MTDEPFFFFNLNTKGNVLFFQWEKISYNELEWK